MHLILEAKLGDDPFDNHNINDPFIGKKSPKFTNYHF